MNARLEGVIDELLQSGTIVMLELDHRKKYQCGYAPNPEIIEENYFVVGTLTTVQDCTNFELREGVSVDVDCDLLYRGSPMPRSFNEFETRLGNFSRLGCEENAFRLDSILRIVDVKTLKILYQRGA